MNSTIEIRPNRHIYLTFYRHPTPTRTVFLIHGLGGRSDQWREQIPLLKENFNIIAADLLGHGKSAKPITHLDKTYSFSEFDLDLKMLFHQYGGERNIIMGHSYGGALATSLTMEHQDRIDKLILIAPSPCAPSKPPALYAMPSFLLECMRPWLEKKFQRLAFFAPANPDLLKAEAEAGKNNSMAILKAMINGMKTIPRIDMTMITVPCLTIMGEQDGIVPVNRQQNFYQQMPHQQFEMIKQASHMVMLEQPARVNEIIAKAL